MVDMDGIDTPCGAIENIIGSMHVQLAKTAIKLA